MMTGLNKTQSSPILLEAQKTFSKLLQTLENKGKDYATDADVYQNFRLAETLLKIPVNKSIMSRLIEKVSRISNLLDKNASVKEETIDDTLDDLIGLAIVLKAKLREEREHQQSWLGDGQDIPVGSGIVSGTIKVAPDRSVPKVFSNVGEHLEFRPHSISNDETATLMATLMATASSRILSELSERYSNPTFQEDDGSID
jgi:hypothetical protein